MKLLGLDFETTGLNFDTDRITEIGAVLWDTDTGRPLRLFNVLVSHDDAPPLTDEIVALTGITQQMIDSYGASVNKCIPALINMMDQAHAIVAHNGTTFDKPMLQAHLNRLGMEMSDRPWIDTCMDVPYPPRITTRKLVHLAAEHGFLNPFAHRAQFDVLTMLKILECYDLDTVLESARQPVLIVKAQVSIDEREKAKARGYRWNPETKTWRKPIKAHLLAAEQKEAGFPVTIIDPL